MNWRVLFGIVLAVAACLFGWSAWVHRERPADNASATLKTDYLMHDFTMTALDKDGNESVTLQAPYLERMAADHSSNITAPVFRIPDKDRQYWHMVAKTGWVDEHGDLLRLTDDVVGTSPEQAVVPTTFTTTVLDVFPRRNLASTDQRVTISQPNASTTGVGFVVDTKNRHYTLKSKVHSRHAPNSAR
ncbi:MAG: LPS export ABC transporter periplasmic protein LptC [Pseudoxanthomonas sp.]